MMRAIRNGRALIADDDPIMRSLMRARLALLVDEVVEAVDGIEAWQRLTSEAFNVAIVDLNMPNINGTTLIQCVRGHPRTRHMPIVVVTSCSDRSSIDQTMAAGASAFMTKPLAWNVFTSHIEHLMRMSTASAQAERGLSRKRALFGAQRSLTDEIAAIAARSIAQKHQAGDEEALQAFLQAHELLNAGDILADKPHDLAERLTNAIAQTSTLLQRRHVRLSQPNGSKGCIGGSKAAIEAALAFIISHLATRHAAGTEIAITTAGNDTGIAVTFTALPAGPGDRAEAFAAYLACARLLIAAHAAQLLTEAEGNGSERITIQFPRARPAAEATDTRRSVPVAAA